MQTVRFGSVILNLENSLSWFGSVFIPNRTSSTEDRNGELKKACSIKEYIEKKLNNNNFTSIFALLRIIKSSKSYN